MKKYFLALSILLFLYILYLPHYHELNKNRTNIQKLGYTPTGKFYKSLVGEYRWFLGDYLSFKSIVYYGGKTEFLQKGEFNQVEYYNLYRTVEASVILNPYNEDIYYFAQGTFTWDIGRVKEVNVILDYVFKYRTWDYKIPFFLGFNHAYFLKDYKNSAIYYQKASELSHSPLFTNLAARYFYEGGDTAHAIGYIKTMINITRKEELKKQYEIRLKALEGIYIIEETLKRYQKDFGTLPKDIEQLIISGYLNKIPEDPYGGKFYIDEYGKVRTTSKLAFLNQKK